MKTPRTYSHYTKQAARLLGQQIHLQRKQRRLSERDFAQRVGISRTTLQKIENGDLGCELGLVFEAATIAGVTLFDAEPRAPAQLSSQLASVRDKVALLPKSVRKQLKVDDEF